MSHHTRRPPAGDYPVGYGRPPKHTQFKPGNQKLVSGKHRDREPIDVAAILDENVTATRNGKSVKVHPHEAKMLALGKKALARSLSAIDAFLKECEKAGLLEPPPGPQRSGVIVVPKGMSSTVIRRLIELTGHGPPWDEKMYAAVVADLAADQARIDELIGQHRRPTDERK